MLATAGNATSFGDGAQTHGKATGESLAEIKKKIKCRPDSQLIRKNSCGSFSWEPSWRANSTDKNKEDRERSWTAFVNWRSEASPMRTLLDWGHT